MQLIRYLYPTNEELKKIVGKPQHVKTKSRRSDAKKNVTNGDATTQYKVSEPFTVPCNINLELKTARIEETDLIFQYYYTEYKWLVDFAFSALIFNIIVELISFLFPTMLRNDISVTPLWNFLVIFFCLRVLYLLTSPYWLSDESGEKSLCLTFGVFFFVLAMAILVVDESILEFNLDSGYEIFSEEAMLFLRQQGISKESGAAPIWIFKLILAIISGLLGAFLGFPGIRMSNMFIDSLEKFNKNRLLIVLLYLNFFTPLLLILLWIKPLVREYFTGRYSSVPYSISDSTFDQLRVAVVILCCILRFVLTKIHLQVFLDLAKKKVSRLKKEAGRISNVTLQKRIVVVFYYLTAVSLQYLTPVILLVFLALVLRTAGTTDWDSTNALMKRLQKSMLVSNITVNAVQNLRHVFVSELVRAVTSYFTWWTCLAMFITSGFGVVYHHVFNI
ncbi:transmembrane protein 161B-like isoform X2 [Dendronephthya gigantea]|uniref:transmembrane protein 161B-like isoform X2 n=1 Tax=Dendronephthya gigantea TaxID=151771 RepID=UPI00106C368A|nr:transmembrane protein 161B-like isoform X2 [Dendronephthya gigantea]